MYYFLDFLKKKRLLDQKYISYYEIRLLKGKRIHYIFGFFDYYNNFIFLNFHNFCHYFFRYTFNYKKYFLNIVSFDLLFLLLLGVNYYFINNTFYMNQKMYYVFYKRANRLVRKLFLKDLEKNVKGYSWGKILRKQTKLIKKLDYERGFLL